MASRKDYYAALGVAKDAPADEIKRAYRKLARKHHPDVNPGEAASEERFKEISEAYHVLGDEERRRQYDQVGPEAFAQDFDLSDFMQNFQTVFTSAGGRGGGGGVFEGLFGGGGRAPGPTRQQPRKGRDVRVEVSLGLEEAVRGTERDIRYRGADGSSHKTRVKIPAGVKEGQQIRVRGKGESGPGGRSPGDLFLQVRIAAHPRFEIDGSDLRVRVPITVYEAGLGTTVEVPTLDGQTRIKVPAGTRSGQVFKLSGLGAPAGNGRQGALLARIEIVLPETLDATTLGLLERWKEDAPYDPRAATDD